MKISKACFSHLLKKSKACFSHQLKKSKACYSHKLVIGIDGNEANQGNRVGVGQFAFNVIEQLEKIDKNNSYTIYLKDRPLSDLPKERPGWKYSVFGPSKLWTQIALPFKLFTQKEKIDFFYSPSHYAPRFSPVPTIVSIMDLWHHRHPEQFTKKDLYQLTEWEKYSVNGARHIVTISEFSKKEIMTIYNIPAEKITIAYPGFTNYQLSIINDKSNLNFKILNVKNKYKIKGDYLLYLGTLQPKKNILGLIRAFYLVIKQRENLRISLVIAGKKGWLYQEIFSEVKRLGLEARVVFTGFVSEEEKPYLISGATAFVLPSFYEGFGIPVLEAMGLGVPVVASKGGSLPEAGGETALYCDPYSDQSISEAIGKVLDLNEKQRDEIIKGGLRQTEKFSWEKCARKVLEAIEEQNKKHV